MLHLCADLFVGFVQLNKLDVNRCITSCFWALSQAENVTLTRDVKQLRNGFPCFCQTIKSEFKFTAFFFSSVLGSSYSASC